MDKVHRATGKAATPFMRTVSGLTRRGKSGIKDVVYPTEETTLIPTLDEPMTEEKVEAILNAAVEMKEKAKNLTIKEKIKLIKAIKKSMNTKEVTEGVVNGSMAFKGSYEVGAGEETLGHAQGIWACSELQKTYEAFDAGKKIKAMERRHHSSGRELELVFPSGQYDHLLFPGYEVEVWFPPGEEVKQAGAEDLPEPQIVSLLASGNQVPQVVGDILHCLFAESGIVIAKLNPVNDYLLEPLTKGFAPAIEAGLLTIINGGIDVSTWLVHASVVDMIHMTGSDKTYDTILWGPVTQDFVDGLPSFCKKPDVVEAPDGKAALIEKRKAENGKLNLDIPFSAELGNCTPIIVTPGKFSAKEIDFHARNSVAMLVHNGSFNCLAAQVIITDSRWPQREEFLDAFQKHMDNTAPRAAYYPGAIQRREGFVKAYDGQGRIYYKGEEGLPENVMEWTLISGLDSDKFDVNSHGACTEAFGGVVLEVPLKLDAKDEPALASSFLPAAVQMCNEVLWGTLCCCIIIPPSAKKADPEACEKAIVDLKYGNIVVNAATIVGYGIPMATWGGWGYPPSGPTDIQSGNGFVHNTMMYQNCEKSVIRCPFSNPYTPVWMHDNRNLATVATRAKNYWANPNLANFTALAANGMRG